MAAQGQVPGLVISVTAHAALIGLAVFWADIFNVPDHDPIESMETTIISEAEFSEIVGETGAAPSAPRQAAMIAEPEPTPVPPPPEPEPEIAEPAPAPPPAPDLSELPPEPDAPPLAEEPPVADLAPYEIAPPPPAPLALRPEALQDSSPDPSIREALPPLRVAAAPEEPEPQPQDAPPEADAAAEEPPVAAPPTPQIAEAPEQPAPQREDPPPAADKPDTPPEPEIAETPPEPAPKPEPAPEPEVAEAPPAPRLRPKAIERKAAEERKAATPPKKPLRSLEDELDSALAGLDQAQPSRPAPQPAAPSRPASQPLTSGEKSAFAFNFKRFWQPPSPGPDLAELVVTVEVHVAPDGQLIGKPKLVSPSGALTARQATAFFNAQYAVERGAPYQGPPEKYDRWSVIRVTFDPAKQETTVN